MATVGRAYRATSRVAGSAPIGRRGGSLAIPPAADRRGHARVLVPVIEQLGFIGGLALVATAPVWVESEAVFRLVVVLLSPWLD